MESGDFGLGPCSQYVLIYTYQVLGYLEFGYNLFYEYGNGLKLHEGVNEVKMTYIRGGRGIHGDILPASSHAFFPKCATMKGKFKGLLGMSKKCPRYPYELGSSMGGVWLDSQHWVSRRGGRLAIWNDGPSRPSHL
ncbi:hypothetical protein KY289_007870 [Solanum tuberosum]|nr:hypothetical protein KY289_007870 [Solanum tuberosum]